MSRVRVGALLYGVRPFHTEHMPFEDRESLAFRTTVSQVRDVAAGEVVGYSDDQVLELSLIHILFCSWVWSC